MLLSSLLSLLRLWWLSLSLSTAAAAGNETSSTIEDVVSVCRSTGCFARHNHRRPHKFVDCSTIPHTYYGRTNCRYGYPSSLNLSYYDFVYDFNSLYVYESSHYEGLAWAGPERAQFVFHALKYRPRRVAVLVPLTQQRWTHGIVWSLQQLGILVDSFPYNNHLLKGANITLSGVPWRRDSNKWIGLEQSCKTVCKPCFRVMTLSAYGIKAPRGHNMTRGTCKDMLPYHYKSCKNLPYRSIETISTDPILHSTLRQPDYKTQVITCTHIALIIRMGHYRGLVYEEYSSIPPGQERFKERYHIRDYRMIEVFQARFGIDKVKIYFGNGTTEELLHTFSNACAIVGPGGAAFANVLFAQPYTYILEIQAYYPSYSHTKGELLVRYESNIEAGVGTDVTWDMYRIEATKLTPNFVYENLTDTLLTITGTQKVFARIAYETNYVLSMQDYLTMADTTCENVKHLSENMIC